MPGADVPELGKEGSRFTHLLVGTERQRHEHKKWVADPTPVPKLGRAPTKAEVQMARSMLKDHIAEHYRNMHDAFHYFDQDGSGKIATAEVERVIQMWNLPIPHEVVQQLLLDADKDGEIDYSEFIATLARDTVQNARTDGHAPMPGAEPIEVGPRFRPVKHEKWVEDPTEMPQLNRAPTKKEVSKGKIAIQDKIAEHYKDMHEAFKYIDLDGSGMVSEPEVERALSMWNVPVPREVIDTILKQASHAENGQIDYGEFLGALAREHAAYN